MRRPTKATDEHESWCDALKGAGQNCNCLFGFTVTKEYMKDRIKYLREEAKHWEKRLRVLTRLENRL